MKTIGSILVLGLAWLSVGCGSEQPTVTKQEEEYFRNPPKEPPPEAAAGMREAMEKARQANSGK